MYPTHVLSEGIIARPGRGCSGSTSPADEGNREIDFMDNSQTVKEVRWLDVFPWLRLWNCLWIAITPGSLVTAFVGVILTYLGWGIIDAVMPVRPPARIVSGNDPAPPDHAAAETKGGILSEGGIARTESPFPVGVLAVDEPSPAGAVAGFVKSKSVLGKLVPQAWRVKSSWGVMRSIDRLEDPMIGIWQRMSAPFAALFCAAELSWLDRIRLVLQGTWIVAIWALFGSMLTRHAALELAGGDHAAWRDLWQFATSRWLHNFLAPLSLVFVVLLLWGLLALGGMLLLSSDPGLALAGLLWPAALAIGLVATLTLVGLMFGWPLLSASISADGQDGFGAVGTAFSYVYRRPLPLAFFVIVAAVLGWLAWVIVSALAESLISVTHAAAVAGLSDARARRLTLGGDVLGPLGKFGVAAIRGWHYLVQSVAVSFLFSYFWAATTMIYLLLRRSVDGTDWNEVFVEEAEEERYVALPPIGSVPTAVPSD